FGLGLELLETGFVSRPIRGEVPDIEALARGSAAGGICLAEVVRLDLLWVADLLSIDAHDRPPHESSTMWLATTVSEALIGRCSVWAGAGGLPRPPLDPGSGAPMGRPAPRIEPRPRLVLAWLPVMRQPLTPDPSVSRRFIRRVGGCE